MARNDGRIEAGQKLAGAISARAWNRAQDAADRVLGVGTGFTAGGATGADAASNIVMVHNQTGSAVPVGGALRILVAGTPFDGGTLDGNNAASSSLKAMFQNKSYAGQLPTLGDPIAVALEPIASGKVGRMAIRGSVFFRLRMKNELHKYAAPLPNDCTQLQSAGCGPVRILYKDGGLGDGKNAFGVM